MTAIDVRIGLAVLAWGVSLACAGSPGAPPPPVAAAAREPALRYPIAIGLRSSPLRDLRRSVRVAALTSPIGVSAAAVGCADGSWSKMRTPDGGIDFDGLDGIVTAQQALGFRDLLICLDTGPMGPGGVRGRLGTRSAIPEPQELAAYSAWVTSVVERYDADGVEDLPGLLYPVRLYEIGVDLASQGPGALDPYLLMLERAHRAAHAAAQDVVVAHAALLVTGLPDGLEGRRIGLLSAEHRARLLDHADRFDALNLQVVGSASDLDAALAELSLAAARRGWRKPVIVSHAAPSPLIAWGIAACEPGAEPQGLIFRPAAETDRCRLAEHLRRLLSGDERALGWTLDFAAAEMVRKSLVAASHGVARVYLGPLEDVDWWKRGPLQGWAGLTPFTGIVDVRAGTTRPAYDAIMQLVALLRDRDRVVRVPLGRPDVWLYAVTGSRGTAWAGWYEPGHVVLPGDPPRTTVIEFDSGTTPFRIERLLEDRRGGGVRALPVDGRVRVELGPTPVFLHPEGPFIAREETPWNPGSP